MKPDMVDMVRAAVVVWSPRVLGTFALGCALALAWRWAGPRSFVRCPGPRLLRAWINPWRWLRRGTCDYDLAGLTTLADGCVRCPECGLRVRPKKRPRPLGGWRFEVIGPACLAAALACRYTPFIHGGRWLGRFPTPCLLALETLAPSQWSRCGRSALEERLDGGRLSGWEKEWLCRAAVGEMARDAVDGNAEWACSVLQGMGELAVPWLEAALDDDDWQTRQMAASILRSRCFPRRIKDDDAPRPRAYPPTDRLIAVTVEGLRDDALPYDRVRRRETFLSNGFDGVEFLARVGLPAAPACERALRSDDPQQRFLAAAALGMMNSTASVARAAPILAEHLQKNGLGGDAHIATAALPGFGPGVVRFLEPCLASGDSQCRELALRIIGFVSGAAPPAGAADPLGTGGTYNRWSTAAEAAGSWRGASRWGPGDWEAWEAERRE